MTEPLIYETEGAIARVTLNRPEAYNAMDPVLRAAIREAISKVHLDDTIRVVILSGNGKGFSAGTDLSEQAGQPLSMFIEREYRPLLASISTSPKIWIAQVHGTAGGIGAALAMNCDLMTMSENAGIYMAFAAIGLIPDGGNMWLLHRGLGYKRTLQAVIDGRMIPADEAVSFGLANSVHPNDALADETTVLAKRIAEGPALATAAAKRLLRAMDGMSYESAITAEGNEQSALVQSADAREGVLAFLEKRKPVFTGN